MKLIEVAFVVFIALLGLVTIGVGRLLEYRHRKHRSTLSAAEPAKDASQG